MTKGNFHDLDDKLKDAPYYPLGEDAKERIHEQLMKEVEKLEQQTTKSNKWKKATIWAASVAAVVLFSVITLSTLNSNQDTALDTVEVREMAKGDQSHQEKAVPEDDAAPEVETEPYRMEYNTIDPLDEQVIAEWMEDVKATGESHGMYEIVDEEKERYVNYIYSPIYNDVLHYQEDDRIEIEFISNEQLDQSDILLKIEYVPERIKQFIITDFPDSDMEKHEEPLGSEYINGSLQIGMSKSEVNTIIEEPYTIVENSKNGTEMWRYDFGKKDSYVPYEYEENDVIYDSVDLDGIASGNIDYQLFVEWEVDNLIGYSLYFQDETGQLFSYRVFPDGNDKLEEINQ